MPAETRGAVVNGGGLGETMDSLLGEALSEGVADGRLCYNPMLNTCHSQEEMNIELTQNRAYSAADLQCPL